MTDNVQVDKGRGNTWLITLADLATLLLTFFVLLFSMSQVAVDDWNAVKEALGTSLNPKRSSPGEDAGSRFSVDKIVVSGAANIDYLHALIVEKFVDEPVLGRSIVQRLEDRLVISLPADGLFEPGQAALSAAARDAAFALGDSLRYFSNRIEVYGHADPRPARAPDTPSNWELSLARAAAFAEGLREYGYTRPIRAFGYGDSRFAELSPALALDERYRLARRVDVVIREDDGEVE